MWGYCDAFAILNRKLRTGNAGEIFVAHGANRGNPIKHYPNRRRRWHNKTRPIHIRMVYAAVFNGSDVLVMMFPQFAP